MSIWKAINKKENSEEDARTEENVICDVFENCKHSP